jgi:hypothetical protein
MGKRNKSAPSVSQIREAAWEITQQYGACMFRQLFSGSEALLLKCPNRVETTTGALVWRNSRTWTVDIVTIGDHHDTGSPIVLRIPAWKRHA